MSKKTPTTTAPLLVTGSNLSAVWSEVFIHIVDHPGKQIAPLVLSITGFDDHGVAAEDPAVRLALDSTLALESHYSTEDVAYTIFPQRLWTMAQGNRTTLYQFYRMAFPAYQAANRSLNRKGLYFERLVNYGRGPKGGNQLEWILSQYEARHEVRRSMLQASVFDPEHDHVSQAQISFPCLQQVSFDPTPAGLVVNAFYATQQVFNKAYGNYLGLAQLGAFMAHEMKIPLARVNVMAGVEKLDKIGKTNSVLEPLIAAARACVAKHSDPDGNAAIAAPRQLAAA